MMSAASASTMFLRARPLRMSAILPACLVPRSACLARILATRCLSKSPRLVFSGNCSSPRGCLARRRAPDNRAHEREGAPILVVSPLFSPLSARGSRSLSPPGVAPAILPKVAPSRPARDAIGVRAGPVPRVLARIVTRTVARVARRGDIVARALARAGTRRRGRAPGSCQASRDSQGCWHACEQG